MTGFGSVEEMRHIFTLSVEVKSVNHRFLEMRVRLPSDWNDIEISVREFIKKKFQRGYFDISIRRELLPSQASGTYIVNTQLAKNYYEALLKVTKALKTSAPSPDVLFRNSDFIHYQSSKISETMKWKTIKPSLEKACRLLQGMRIKEGRFIVQEIKKRLNILSSLENEIAKMAPKVKQAMEEKLKKRVAELGQTVEITPERLAQEVIFYAERADITEEVVRLKSHLIQFKGILSSKEAQGKQLDFLVQEMNREINTISSKAHDLGINKMVVVFKTELEKLKEQIQNIE